MKAFKLVGVMVSCLLSGCAYENGLGCTYERAWLPHGLDSSADTRVWFGAAEVPTRSGYRLQMDAIDVTGKALEVRLSVTGNSRKSLRLEGFSVAAEEIESTAEFKLGASDAIPCMPVTCPNERGAASITFDVGPDRSRSFTFFAPAAFPTDPDRLVVTLSIQGSIEGRPFDDVTRVGLEQYEQSYNCLIGEGFFARPVSRVSAP